MDAEDAHPLESRPPTQDDLMLICRSLNDHGARYVVVGGFAIIEQGLTRAAEDIDLLICSSNLPGAPRRRSRRRSSHLSRCHGGNGRPA